MRKGTTSLGPPLLPHNNTAQDTEPSRGPRILRRAPDLPTLVEIVRTRWLPAGLTHTPPPLIAAKRSGRASRQERTDASTETSKHGESIP